MICSIKIYLVKTAAFGSELCYHAIMNDQIKKKKSKLHFYYSNGFKYVEHVNLTWNTRKNAKKMLKMIIKQNARAHNNIWMESMAQSSFFLLFKMTHADSKMIKSRTNRRKSLNCVIKMQKRENFYIVFVFGHT